jgi:hypothetical protein
MSLPSLEVNTMFTVRLAPTATVTLLPAEDVELTVSLLPETVSVVDEALGGVTGGVVLPDVFAGVALVPLSVPTEVEPHPLTNTKRPLRRSSR